MEQGKTLYTEDIERLFKLMVENDIESFKDGDIEMKRESLKILQTKQSHEEQVKIEMEKLNK